MQQGFINKKYNYLVVSQKYYNFNNLDTNANINFILIDEGINTNINNLPNSIYSLEINRTKCSIDNLPFSLKVLKVDNTNITNFDNLPLNLKKLYIYKHKIDNINNLPENLEHLSIVDCYINTEIKNLPKNLKSLYINTSFIKNQQIFCKDLELPDGCKFLNCPEVKEISYKDCKNFKIIN